LPKQNFKSMIKKLTLFSFLFILVISGKTIAQSRAGGSLLKINEVDYDQFGIDTSEFIEIVNPSSTPLALGLVKVLLFNGTSNLLYDSIQLPSGTLNPGEFFVICGSAGTVPNCDLALAASSNIVQNGSPDAIALWDSLWSIVIDAVSYEGGCPSPYVEGVGVPAAQSDSTQNYTSIGRYPDGMDTENNSADFHLQCITPGAPNVNVNTSCQSPVSTGREIKVMNHITVYPNPASERIFVLGVLATQAEQVARVYDTAGQICYQQPVPTGSKGVALDVTSLKSGVYSLVFNGEKGSEKKTFIVAR
jgi:hypothetical protein